MVAAFRQWQDTFRNGLCRTFGTLIALYPQAADSYGELLGGLLAELHEGDEMTDTRQAMPGLKAPTMPHGGTSIVGEAAKITPPTEMERTEIAHKAQDYCDRMAGLIRGLAHVAAWDFPELAQDFHDCSERAGNILRDYKERMGIRDGIPGLSRASTLTEQALSTE